MSENNNDNDGLDFLEKVTDKLFSKDPLSKGEIIQIIFVILLICVILFLHFSTKCSLDCNMCTTGTEMLIQKGFGG